MKANKKKMDLKSMNNFYVTSKSFNSLILIF